MGKNNWLSKRAKPKDWGIPCLNCGYRWCFHGKACKARKQRAEAREKKSIDALLELKTKGV